MQSFKERCRLINGNVFFCLLFICSAALGNGQDSLYDTDHLKPSFYSGRRGELLKFVSDSGLVVLFSGQNKVRSNDVDFPFVQDRNFLYFTGYAEPNGALLLFKKKQEIDTVITSEVLFVNERNAAKEVWDGKVLGIEGARKKLGVRDIRTNKTFQDIIIDWRSIDTLYYLPLPEYTRDDKMDKGDIMSMYRFLQKEVEKNHVKTNTRDLPERFAFLRQTKTAEELALLRKAINASCDAHFEVIRMLASGMYEYDAEAVFEYVVRTHGCEDEGYPSIVGGGGNSCVLHYNTNRKKLVDGDMLVIDAGGEYHGYTADITRTLPVNGKFTPEQKIIYDIVLEAQEAGIKACVKGNKFWEPNKEATSIISKRLMELGIIKNATEVRKYFMHGTSHYLGLDVHDPGLYGVLLPGQVITVEPGIYIAAGSDCDPKWWNIGVRIEDDILITESKPENLSISIPRKAAEVEQLMKDAPKYFREKGKRKD